MRWPGLERRDVARHPRDPTRSRLWREWCFLRVALWGCRWNLALLGGLLVGGGLLFQHCEPERHRSLPQAVYYTFSLIFGPEPDNFPTAIALQVLFFIVPVLGLLVVLDGLVDFAFRLRDRRQNERSWCRIMAASLSNHIILIGLGKLGYRTFGLLRRMGAAVVVIERDPANQFLDEVRRDGSPLLVGDARRDALLEEANVARARSIVLASNDDLTNLEVALDARRMNPGIRVVLRMFDQNLADKVRAGFDIQTAMSQSALSAPAFVVAALEGNIVGGTLVDDELLIMERWTVHGPPLAGCSVGEILARFGLSVLRRRSPGGNEQRMPPPDTPLQSGDVVLVQGSCEALAALRAAASAARVSP